MLFAPLLYRTILLARELGLADGTFFFFTPQEGIFCFAFGTAGVSTNA